MGANKTSTVRLEARIRRELHTTLKRAAGLQNVTMTDFDFIAISFDPQSGH